MRQSLNIHCSFHDFQWASKSTIKFYDVSLFGDLRVSPYRALFDLLNASSVIRLHTFIKRTVTSWISGRGGLAGEEIIYWLISIKGRYVHNWILDFAAQFETDRTGNKTNLADKNSSTSYNAKCRNVECLYFAFISTKFYVRTDFKMSFF